MPERDGSRTPVVDEGLGVRPLVRPRRRVARVPDRHLAGERLQLLLVEDVRDEAHLAQNRQPPAVGNGDPCRLLAAVLQREETEVGEPRHVPVGRTDAEHPAHQSRPPRRSQALELHSEQRTRRRPRPSAAAATPPRARRPRVAGGHGDDRAPADLAEPLDGVVGELHLGAEPGVDRRLGEHDREPALGGVVDERATRRDAPEEPDQRGLRPRSSSGAPARSP